MASLHRSPWSASSRLRGLGVSSRRDTPRQKRPWRSGRAPSRERTLSDDESCEVLATLDSERVIGLAPAQVLTSKLSQGRRVPGSPNGCPRARAGRTGP